MTTRERTSSTRDRRDVADRRHIDARRRYCRVSARHPTGAVPGAPAVRAERRIVRSLSHTAGEQRASLTLFDLRLFPPPTSALLRAMPGVDGAGVSRLPSASIRDSTPIAAHGSLWHALRDAAAREARRARSPSSQPARAAFEEAKPAAGDVVSLTITALLHESSALAALFARAGHAGRPRRPHPPKRAYTRRRYRRRRRGAVAVNCTQARSPSSASVSTTPAPPPWWPTIATSARSTPRSAIEATT